MPTGVPRRAAPKIDRIRIGFIGLGNRGSEAVPRIIHIDGVDVRVLCDIKAGLVQQALVNTSEKTKKHLIFLENECYDFFVEPCRCTGLHTWGLGKECARQPLHRSPPPHHR